MSTFGDDAEVDHQTDGKLGTISIPVRPGHPGEVLLPVRGGIEAFAAFSDEPIAKHETVVVVGTSGPRSVVVARF